MEDLMRMNPMIERKMSGFRKKRYLQTRNNFPQIKEEDYEGEEKEWIRLAQTMSQNDIVLI